MLQPENAVGISSWFEDPEDTQLCTLLPWFVNAAHDDVRGPSMNSPHPQVLPLSSGIDAHALLFPRLQDVLPGLKRLQAEMGVNGGNFWGDAGPPQAPNGGPMDAAEQGQDGMLDSGSS